jgi:hypothetical protein
MVEIRIDTGKDSKEDLQKVIEFLQKFIDEGKAKETEANPFNIFGDAPIENEMPKEEPIIAPQNFNLSEEITKASDEDEDKKEENSKYKPTFY